MFDPARIYIQQLQAKASSPKDILQAATIAESRGHKAAADLLRKSIFDSASFADDADFRAAQRGFMELVRARGLIGRIPGWRRTSFHTPTLRATVAPAAEFVGQGSPIPVTELDLQPVKLQPTKIATIAITTDEVARGASPGFDSALSADLVAAIAAAEAAALTDPSNTGVPGESPASLTAGLTPIASTGNPAQDLAALVANFGGDLDRAVLITSPQVGFALHGLGFDGAGPRGGEVAGIPLFTSSGVPHGSNGASMILIDPGMILLADEGADIDVASEASIQVSATPDDPTTDSTVLVSLWQRNLTGFLALRRVGWQAAPGSVAYAEGL